MRTGHRVALTATLATTAALGVAGVSWGIGTTMAGDAPASTASWSEVGDTTDDTTGGGGHGYGRAGGGRSTGSAHWGNERDGSGYGTGTGAADGTGNGYGAGTGDGTGTCDADCAGTGTGTGAGTGNRYGVGSGSGPSTGTGAVGGSGNGNRAGGAGSGGTGDHSDIPAAVPGATISDAVVQELLYLVEEEKLAGDVYELGQATYGARVFTNIARAEDSHADEVRVLLDRYGITDPTLRAPAGVFVDEDLQALYDDLATQVTTSWSDAVDAGVLIERTDIADLQELLAEDLPADVRAVAENLLAGSERHLAAFQRQVA